MRFQLIRYFTLTSLIAIAIVAAALMFFEARQSRFFKQVQDQELEVFQQTQDTFATRQDGAARRDLLSINEAGNVNLTRLFANALWERDFAPFVARASQVPVSQCRDMADVKDDKTGKMVAPADKKACFAAVGQKIREFRDYEALNAKVFDSMKKSTVFKIKVFDLRGITVYSSEAGQMGEDKANNAGWKGAAEQGKATSELTFRDKFSAFEGVVEKRDLISSYLPVYAPGSDKIVAVFEVYSDVTPFLSQIKATSQAIRKTADENLRKLEQQTQENQSQVTKAGYVQIAIVAALLLGLYAALFVIVRRAQRLIEQQAKERDTAQQQLAQAEKMATLGQMVAGVAHQLNTPLAFSQNNVQMVREAIDSLRMPLEAAHRFADIMSRAGGDQVVLNIGSSRPALEKMKEHDVDLNMLKQMLDDVLGGIEQMSELVINLRDFTRLDRAKTVAADINKALHNVIYIAKSSISNNIEVVEEFSELPPVECNVSQLNQVFLNLINNAAQALLNGGRITIRTSTSGKRVCIEVQDNGAGISPDVLPHIFEMYYTTKAANEGTGLGLSIARDIVRQHGGDLTVRSQLGQGATFVVDLPVTLMEKAAA